MSAFEVPARECAESAQATPPCGIQVGDVRSPFGHLSGTSHFVGVAAAAVVADVVVVVAVVAFGSDKVCAFRRLSRHAHQL